MDASKLRIYFFVVSCSEFILPTSDLSSLIFFISLLMAGSKMFLSWVVSSLMVFCRMRDEFLRLEI